MDLPGFDIRYTEPSDGSYLKEWLSSAGMLHWFPMSEGKELEDAIACWIGFARFQASLTATLDGVPCGMATLFLMPYRKVSHHALFKVIVDPKHQKKGIGGSLIKNVKHLAKQKFRLDFIHIEVFEGNPLLSLLHEYDFHEFARQERFVKEGEHYLGRVLLESFL